MERDQAKEKIKRLMAQCQKLADEHEINFVGFSDHPENDERMFGLTNATGIFFIDCLKSLEEEIGKVMEKAKEGVPKITGPMGEA